MASLGHNELNILSAKCTPFLRSQCINTLRPKQNGRHFPDDIFKWIFLNENVWISINISLKFVPRGPINNIPTLVQVMAWRPSGDKPLSEPMMVSLPTHMCVTRPQWINNYQINGCLICPVKNWSQNHFSQRGSISKLCASFATMFGSFHVFLGSLTELWSLYDPLIGC